MGNLEGLFLPIISSAGNTQSLQAETGRSHHLADSLQQLHTPAEEDTKGSEAQPATVTGDLEGGGGGDGVFLLPKGPKYLEFSYFKYTVCVTVVILISIVLESPPSITAR